MFRYLAALGIGLSCVITVAAVQPAMAGPPFITDDPEPVDLGHWEVYGFSAGASGHGDTTGLGPSVEVNYGAAPGLQLHVIGGMAYDSPDGHIQMLSLIHISEPTRQAEI